MNFVAFVTGGRPSGAEVRIANNCLADATLRRSQATHPGFLRTSRPASRRELPLVVRHLRADTSAALPASLESTHLHDLKQDR